MSYTNIRNILASFFAALLLNAGVATLANADTNPFGVADNVTSTSIQVAEGKCGEGKCGEGKCGDKKDDDKKGKCGEGKCGDKKDDKKGKCGEGKCGGK